MGKDLLSLLLQRNIHFDYLHHRLSIFRVKNVSSGLLEYPELSVLNVLLIVDYDRFKYYWHGRTSFRFDIPSTEQFKFNSISQKPSVFRENVVRKLIYFQLASTMSVTTMSVTTMSVTTIATVSTVIVSATAFRAGAVWAAGAFFTAGASL